MSSSRARRGTHVLVMAKSPIPGKVKTRLCPPLSYQQAARVAEASLAQTLQTVANCHADRKLVALDGKPGGWLPPGFIVFDQESGSLNRRLAAAWRRAGGPGLQIGMDTPQVTPEILDGSLAVLDAPGVTAALGPCLDGGWWAIGLGQRWDEDVFTGVPMSTSSTARRQLEGLQAAGHTVRLLGQLRDIDTAEDADAVAALLPESLLSVAWASATSSTGDR